MYVKEKLAAPLHGLLEERLEASGRSAVRLAGQALAMWLLLLAVMMVNGTVRVLVLQPRLGESAARQLATVVGIVLMLALSRLFVRWTGVHDAGALLGVGALWLVLTLAFEFGFGAVRGASLDEMLADYDVLRGRLWPLFLAATLLGPWLGRGAGGSG